MLSDINGTTDGPFDSVTASVWRKFSAGAALDPWNSWPITSVSVQRRICTQRRRLGSEIG
jgi:hypothetical protein